MVCLVPIITENNKEVLCEIIEAFANGEWSKAAQLRSETGNGIKDFIDYYGRETYRSQETRDALKREVEAAKRNGGTSHVLLKLIERYREKISGIGSDPIDIVGRGVVVQKYDIAVTPGTLDSFVERIRGDFPQSTPVIIGEELGLRILEDVIPARVIRTDYDTEKRAKIGKFRTIVIPKRHEEAFMKYFLKNKRMIEIPYYETIHNN